jgi:hypothetical protein
LHERSGLQDQAGKKPSGKFFCQLAGSESHGEVEQAGQALPTVGEMMGNAHPTVLLEI